MTKSIFKTAFATFAILATLAFAIPNDADAASCTNFLNTCASNCRAKHASDKSCVSDHCSPKLATCKSTGCWQQGGDFGNALTCNLDKK